MLSYKEYKLLNESLYGAFNLGLKSPGQVGGIVSDSSVNGTEAALEAESEDALEEAKKGKKMKKKMDSVEMIPDDEEKKKVPHDDHEEDEEEDEDEDHEDDEDEDHEEDEDEEDDEDDHDEEKSMKDKPMFMKKNMKKKSKKEWSEVIEDMETILEDISDEDALEEIKIGLETIKEGMKKGMKKHMGCGTKKCGKYMDKDDEGDEDESDEDGDEKGLTDAQKKLPPALRKAILAKKGKKKGKKDKKCMNEEEAAWWNSVNSMLGSDPNQKNWDGGWKEVGEVEQAVREGVEPSKKKIVNEINYTQARNAYRTLYGREVEAGLDDESIDRLGKFERHVSRRALGLSGLISDKEGNQVQMTINQIDVGMSKPGWISRAKPNIITLHCDFDTTNDRRMAHKYGEITIDLNSKSLNSNARGFENIRFERNFAMKIVDAINKKAGDKIVDMTFFKIA